MSAEKPRLELRNVVTNLEIQSERKKSQGYRRLLTSQQPSTESLYLGGTSRDYLFHIELFPEPLTL